MESTERGKWPSNYTAPVAKSGFGGKVVSNNWGRGGFGVTDAVMISGHRSVKDLDDLYAIPEEILSSNKSNGGAKDTYNDSLGQLWYVTNQDKYYKLIDFRNHDSESGWQEVQLESKSTADSKYVELTEKLTTLENEIKTLNEETIKRSKLVPKDKEEALNAVKFLWTGTLKEFNDLSEHPIDTTFIITG